MKIRHNSVVQLKDEDGALYSFYGRVIKSLPDNKFLWLCCGLHFRVSDISQIELSDYKGYKNHKGRFIPMTSLRKLKIAAKRFHYEFAHNTPLDYEYIK